MRRGVKVIAAYLAFAVVSLLLVEGVYSIARWKHADRSITYDAYKALGRFAGSQSSRTSASSVLPVATRDEIEALIPAMVEAGVGMGNVPYKELVTERAAINAPDENGCLRPKPSLRKTTAYIRTGEYDRFDPPSIFFDRDKRPPAAIEQFVATYGIGRASYTSNAASERITIPEVQAPRKVLIAGDSVAAGSMIDDSETLASHLQATTSAVAYVNLGINGAEAKDIVCQLEKAAARYRGAIDGLIYIYSENDFRPGEALGRPGEVVAWLKDFAKREGIGDVTVVFAPYIYNIVPQFTRFAGSRGADHGVFWQEAGELETQASAAGFRYLSIADMARDEALASGTDLAALALFVDHAHLSNRGSAMLAARLRRGENHTWLTPDPAPAN